MKVTLNVEYTYGDVVYIITDSEQEKGIIVGYEILPGDLIKYRVNSENYTTTFFDFEISSDKTVF